VPNTLASYQLIARDISKALVRVEKDPVVDRDTDYYLANITKVKTIEEFVKNDRLFGYAMKAHGLEDMTYAKAFMVKALKEGITDPDSFANKLTDKRYAEFVKSYNFARYGELATSYNRAQHDVPKTFATQVALSSIQTGHDFYAAETGYYLSNIGEVASIDDLMADDRLMTYAMAAFNLDADTETPETIRAMLEGGVSDPGSPANTAPNTKWKDFVTAFDFVEHGADTTARDAVVKDVPSKYASGTGLTLVKASDDYLAAETANFTANISKVKTVTAFLNDRRLLTFAMATYGLNADSYTDTQIRGMIEGGIQNPSSPANASTDERWINFVTAFDFEQFGETATSQDAAKLDTPELWKGKASLGLIKLNDAYVASETAYYSANVGKLESIDDLMANKRLLNFALTAYGLDPSKETPATIRKMLEGGVSDPASPANALTDKRYAGFVTAFNFVEHGETTTTFAVAQRPSIDKYVRQTLEERAGQENEGVRLALYFERKAATLTNFYQILADPALSQVLRTSLGLPDSFATANIDQQVKMFEKRLKIEDFSDPEKLSKFLTRFTTMWEMNNPTQSPQALASVLFSQPTTFGISTDLLLTMQKLKF
jgi:hypothetical protein